MSWLCDSGSLHLASGFLTASPLTLACWTKLAGVTGGGFVILGKDGTATHSWWLWRFPAGGGGGDNFDATTRDAAGSATAGHADAITDTTTWRPVIASFASSTSRKVMVSGAGEASDTTSVVVDPAQVNAFRVGNFFHADVPANARIAHVAVWNIELSAPEKAAYSAGANPLTIARANLIAYWPMTQSETNPVDTVGGRVLTAAGPTFSTDSPTVDPIRHAAPASGFGALFT